MGLKKAPEGERNCTNQGVGKLILYRVHLASAGVHVETSIFCLYSTIMRREIKQLHVATPLA